jgi:hypothetical protein
MSNGGRMESEPDEEDDEDGARRNGGSRGRGFAGMDPEERREIASKGGRASHGGRGGE